MKKFMKIVGVIVLLIVLSIGGCVGWFKYQQSAYSVTAVPYIKQTLPILAHWDKEVVKSYMTPESLKATSDADLEKLLNWFKKLGALHSLDEPTLVNDYSGVDGSGAVKLLTFNVQAHFEAGDALIMLRLSDLGSGQFKVYSFNVNSKALMG